MGISQDLCEMVDFDCSGEIVMIVLKDTTAIAWFENVFDVKCMCLLFNGLIQFE